jgi:hypothetical protein
MHVVQKPFLGQFVVGMILLSGAALLVLAFQAALLPQ